MTRKILYYLIRNDYVMHLNMSENSSELIVSHE